MSHVEPRRVHRADGGRIGFKFGTIPGFQNQAVTPQDESGLDILLRNYGNANLGYQQAGLDSLGNSSTQNETMEERAAKQRAASMAKIAEYNRKRIEEQYGDKGIPSINRPEIKKGWGWLENDLDKAIREKKESSSDYSSLPYTAAEKVQLRKTLSTARDQEKLYDTGVNIMEGEDRPASTAPVAKNEPNYAETKKTDPREAIKKDRDFLKSILEGEDYQDMSRGEAALVIARAIAEPGPIANKIKVANELAIPIIRSKRKEDRELTLEAYKTYREKELEDIKSGKATDLEKQVRAMTDAYMRANKEDKRGRDVIYNEMFEKRLGEEKSLDKSRLVGFTGIQQQLESKVNAVRKAEADKAIGKKIDEEVLKENKAFIESVKSRYPDFYKANFPELRANGGRIGYAEGTLKPTENNQIESTPTPEDAGTQQSQLKPVVKLSFQELRSRLPKEITNDIVGLISNSEQALQDFAYIKTQQDVNNFNIKYGVNLVLPSNR